MIDQAFEELKLTGSLPSPTGVGLLILQITQRDDFTIGDLSRALQSDPTLTGRILKLANSSTNGGARGVTNVQDACVRLGARTVRNLSLSFTLVAGHRSGTCTAFDYEKHWSRSLALAVAAQTLAARFGDVVPGEAFTCGLLAHIGRLALASIHPTTYSKLIERANGGDMDRLAALERIELGLDHRELAAAMLADWRLPESFSWTATVFDRRDLDCDAPDEAARRMARALRTAHALAPTLAMSDATESPECKAAFEGVELARKELACNPDEMARLLSGIAQDFVEWGKLMSIAVPRPPSYELLRRRATETNASSEAPSAPAPIAENASPNATATPKSGGLRVLVADDDPVTLKLIAFHLGKAGHRVTTATNGKQAMALAIERLPQILITDWSMPEMDGVELTKALRSSDEGKKVQIILLTGREEEANVLKAFESGVDEYLNKPFNPQILLARVRAGERVVHLCEQIERDREEREQQLAQLAVLTRKLQTASITDALTELPNRRFAMQHLEHEVARLRVVKVPLSVIMIDIDKFKSVNDGFGHDTGDVVLKETASLLRRTIRPSDRVCRLGGEEFLVVLPRTALAEAMEVAERLRAAAEANVIKKGEFARAVTLSLGVAQFDSATPTVDALIKLSDVRVYAAKNSGRNRVVGDSVEASTLRKRTG